MTTYLKKKRVAAGLTRQELADKIGCHKQQVYNFETGASPVPIKYAAKMAEALGVPEKDLIEVLKQIKLKRYLEGEGA